MQDRSWNDTLPLSVLLKEVPPPGGMSVEGDGGVFSEASSDGDVYLNSMPEFQGGGGDFLELSAFLSQDEINRSLDLAREAMSDAGDACELSDTPGPTTLTPFEEGLGPSSLLSPTPQTLTTTTTEALPAHLETSVAVIQDPSEATKVTSSQNVQLSRPAKACTSPGSTASPDKLVCGKPTAPVYKQERPRLVHRGLELNERAASTTEFCSRAATFIEELSSIFKGSSRLERQGEEDSSSPDSGYLSPKSQRSAAQQTQTTASPSCTSSELQQGADQGDQAGMDAGLQVDGVSADGPMAPPRFTQKLKSQEVSEGSPIRLECRVTGNPQPLVRWFCEGRELHHCPDIQIWRDGDLHMLVIAEAFEDDTGRYTCVASNALGADNTSAEVYIEGASSSDSEGEGSTSKSKPGAMPQVQKKTASVSLTIRTSPPKSPEKAAHCSTLVQPLLTTPQRVLSPVSSQYTSDGCTTAPPTFTKLLQDAQASEGQVVVLECRVRGSPPLQVRWSRQGQEIQDSPDFRILQKKPRSAGESEEICTLVIAEAFPEDGGQFCCRASNEYGSVSCSAQLSVAPASEESAGNGVSGDDGVFEDNQIFPPPPPPTEISLLEVPPKTPPSAEAFQINELDIWPSVTATPVHITTDTETQPNGTLPSSHTPRRPSKDVPPPTLTVKETAPPTGEAAPPPSPSPAKESPPIPTKPKPKLNAEQLKQLHDQVLLEQQEAAQWQKEVPPPPQPQQPQEAPPPSPPLPPPPSFQELECSTMQTSTFNYARPKQFIAAQSPGGGGGYTSQSSSSSSCSLASPLSPSAPHKPFSHVALPPFQQLPKGGSVESPGSPSFPPPPPPFLSTSNVSSPIGPPQDFPPPPPPPPPLTTSPTCSENASPFTSTPQSPAGFLASVLPATPPAPPVNALGLPKGNGIGGFSRKTGRTPRIVTDSEIQGSKDAVIQDLERKLRFKEERLSNGQQRLTYEEKMARRLLGADNAATVFNTQQSEEESATQESSSADSDSVPQKEYKVSSFEQRLISEIEFRLERSPVEESDDDVQHDEDAAGENVAPCFDRKLKHYKVFEGMSVTFSCKVSGDPKPKVYWFKDGKQISKRSEHYRISRDPDGTCSLHTATASLDDDGNYTVMAGNPAGRVSCTGRMMVQAVNQRGRSQRSTPGHIRRPRSRSRDSGEENENIQERHFRPHFLQAPGDLIVQEGKLCRMDCKVSGLPTPDLIWQVNGHTIRPDSAHKMLVRENGVHSLVIEPVTNRDAGVYTCIATNRAGQNSFNLELIVAAKEMHKAPTFIEKLQNTGVAEGYPVRLECRVSGVPFPQIFWKKENESLTHNTDRISMHQDNFGYICMIIQPSLKEDAGWYTVSAKNEAGIVSSTARLDVHTQWQQTHTPKLKKVRPSASRYAALTERGLDVKAAFFPDSAPLPPGTLVESDDL
ncbi:palladin isoform X2 [Brachyhypopomus gauderio]|uniref:palladin isoform X2 n=1 Tax=Brachyhypopomus gauderio TaxID=698409 RepID=UPI00404218C0